MAMSSRHEDASATAKLPHDVKASIVSFLNGQQAKQVALVNRQWKAATEDHLWSRLHVPSRTESGGNDMRGNREIASWKKLRQLLESHPARSRSIREMTVLLVPDALEDRLAVLKLVAPSLTRWTDLFSCLDEDNFVDSCCEYAGLSVLSLAMQPMPALRDLTVHIDGTWTLTLPGLLRMTPSLTHLHLQGRTNDVGLPMREELWPKLQNLITLSVTFHAYGTRSSMVRTIVPLCEKLVTFNLRMAPNNSLKPSGMPVYLGPLLTSSTVENVHLDLPARDNVRSWHWEGVVAYLNDLDDGPPQWKTLSVLTDCIEGHIPNFPSLVTFRMTTRTDQEVGALGTKSQAIRRGGDTRSRSAFGELPSGTTTGLLERNLFESILDAPSLILIEAGYNPILRSFPPSGPDDISHSLHLQSFVKDKEEWPDADTDEDEDDDRADDTLVRCWMAADSSLFRLQPHEFARELPLLQIAAEVSSSPDGSNRYSYHFCPRYMPDSFEIPARYRLPGCTPDPKWIELTYYRNRPLPFVLLDLMFSHIDHERFPAIGQRGLTLPQHVWDMLDGWYSEVEFRVERFGVPRRKEPRAENPDDDYWL